MARTIFRTSRGNGFLAGSFQHGFFGKRTLSCRTEGGEAETLDLSKFGSVRQIVGDGDTVNVSSAANFPIRFLAIDTPESSLVAPDTGRFASTDSPVFQRLLADPFGAEFDPIADLDPALFDHIAARASPDAAAIHHAYAKDAEDALEALILEDKAALGSDQFFLAFAYDALDFFGRLLAYVHPDQPDTPREDRAQSYNARMLATGLAAPYFIFPNVDPFRATGSPLAAAAAATDPETILNAAPNLRAARALVAGARAAERGVFDPARAIPFDAFEFRFLARRAPPSRWVIDLARNERRLLPPQRYIEVPRLEDRLFVPEEFVPLFEATGWKRDGPLLA